MTAANRILILDNELGMGGAEKNLRDFIAHCDRSRVAVSVCCLKAGGHFKREIVGMGVPFYDNLLQHRFDALAFRRLEALLRSERIQLIDTFSHPNTVIFSYLARLRGLVDGVLVSYHAVGGADGGRLVPPYLRPLLGRFDALVALSQSHRRYLVEEEHLPDRLMRVIPNGVDTMVFRPALPAEGAARRRSLGIPEAAVVFACVASLKPIKRIDLLLRAAAPLLRARADVRLLIVGDGPERAALEELARESGIADRAVFAGRCDDVDSILRAADALVLSSRSEAFPKAVLEAMASGLPVIATDVGSVREMVEDGRSAIVVPVGDEASLHAALERLAGDAPARRAFGARGREIVEARFRIEAMCAAREALFDELLSSSPGPPSLGATPGRS